MTGAYYNENDPYAAEWLRNLIAAGELPAGDVDERDIRDVRPADLEGYRQHHFFAGIGGWPLALRLAGWDDAAPVWTGSCPCQPFSAAGKRLGTADERHLWPHWHFLVEQLEPPVVLGEQVASKAGRSWLAGVRLDLEALGYAVGAADLCAAGAGAPHIRQRLFWVAQSDRQRREDESLHLRPGRQKQAAAVESRDGGPADADGRHPGAEGLQRSREHRLVEENGCFGRLGDTERDRQYRTGSIRPKRRHELADNGPDFWSNFDVLPCADGKTRRVESGTFPLAHGAAFDLDSGSALQGKSRANMLRAYGNAIVPQLAAEFIGAFMETDHGLAKMRGQRRR